MFKSVGMHTVLLPMCPTDGPMARGARGDIPLAIYLGQGSTPVLALEPMFGVLMELWRYAADGRRSLTKTSPCTPMSVFTQFFSLIALSTTH